MNDNFRSQLDNLLRLVSDYEALSKKALGFSKTILYKEILFNVSLDFVIANLSPLAFFNLVEYIDADGDEAAAARLYERLRPLLSCRHRWIEPANLLDQNGSPIMYGHLQEFGHVFVCELCTACAIETAETVLPLLGRMRTTNKLSPNT